MNSRRLEGEERKHLLALYKCKKDEGLSRAKAMQYCIKALDLPYKESYVKQIEIDISDYEYRTIQLRKDQEYMEKCKKEYEEDSDEEMEDDFLTKIAYKEGAEE